MTHCPTCNRPLDRSAALIPGDVVLRCKPCKRFAVEPPIGIAVEWLSGGPDLLDRLRRSADEGRQVAAIVGSDDDDPRWSTMGVVG